MTAAQRLLLSEAAANKDDVRTVICWNRHDTRVANNLVEMGFGTLDGIYFKASDAGIKAMRERRGQEPGGGR